MIVIAIVGVLASVAIPAFINYIRKAKTVEAVLALERIKEGARYYYVVDHWLTNGTLSQAMFPNVILNPTPAGGTGSCCVAAGKCITAASVWTQGGWNALHFGLYDPHYYVYSFMQQGVNETATYTARANGDLDCDGTESTFELRGRIDNEGSVIVQGTVIEKEIE